MKEGMAPPKKWKFNKELKSDNAESEIKIVNEVIEEIADPRNVDTAAIQEIRYTARRTV